MSDDKYITSGDNDVISINLHSEALVTFKTDGTLEYGKHYTPDKASRAFWETLANGNPLLGPLDAASERARVATEALQASRAVMEHREQRAAEELADAHGHSYSREFIALALKARSLADAFLAASARPPPHRAPNE